MESYRLPKDRELEKIQLQSSKRLRAKDGRAREQPVQKSNLKNQDPNSYKRK